MSAGVYIPGIDVPSLSFPLEGVFNSETGRSCFLVRVLVFRQVDRRRIGFFI